MRQFFLLFLFLSVLHCFSQGVWTQKASLPGTARGDAMYLSMGTKGYIVGGFDGAATYLKDVWQYDAINNTWTQKQDFIGTARWQGVSFNIGTNGYIGTG